MSMNKQLLLKFSNMDCETRLHVIDAAKDYALYKGIAKRDSSKSKDARVHLPFCLIPTDYPTEWFNYAYNLQTSVNLVLLKIAYSKEILKECLRSTIKADEFTRNLYNIFETVYDKQRKQMTLGIIRSDYLLNCDLTGSINGIKQVENNTIAVGFGGISPGLRDVYRFILRKIERKNFDGNLPENKSCEGIVKAMISAWCVYGKQNAVMLFVVEESTFNIYDQRFLEYKIYEYDEHIEIIRCTFKDLRSFLKLNDQILYVYNKEVALVYFRVGYAPEHYEPEDWKVRLLIEQSAAVKCPSVGLHLAGTKRVQLYLTEEGVLEKFVDLKTADSLRKVFAKHYSLEEKNANIISKAIDHPDEFVLKPEREGGGNNLYGSSLKETLKNPVLERKDSHILMEYINSPVSPNYIIRSDTLPEPCFVHSELGIFGVILGSKEQLCMNETVGHLLRSKSAKYNEGGVSCGSGALDYPYLL